MSPCRHTFARRSQSSCQRIVPLRRARRSPRAIVGLSIVNCRVNDPLSASSGIAGANLEVARDKRCPQQVRACKCGSRPVPLRTESLSAHRTARRRASMRRSNDCEGGARVRDASDLARRRISLEKNSPFQNRRRPRANSRAWPSRQQSIMIRAARSTIWRRHCTWPLPAIAASRAAATSVVAARGNCGKRPKIASS